MAAFAGQYLDGQRKKSFPFPLQELQPSPKDFFRQLALSCMNDHIREAIKTFSFSVSPEDIKNLYRSENTEVSSAEIDTTIRYIHELVHNPKIRAEILWRRVAPSESQASGEKILTRIDPMVRELGRERAISACEVLRAPWCTPWLPANRLADILRARILEQHSVAATCTTLGIG